MNPTPEILDCTIRDGSYCIDFQFTAEDTALICSALDSAGICWIEIGHGLGLGADAAGHGPQGDTDEAYIAASRAAVKIGKVGAFFIPGIGTQDDVKRGADGGIDFIRIGTNITEHEQQLPFIESAKASGLIVSCNLMKSYAVTPEVFGETAAALANAGADVVCLVDSAGGMLPEDVKNYIEATRAVTEVDVGFHGHDNLSMAVANLLAAVDAGARIVDTSLMGMGRSEGNAVTEVVAAILERRGVSHGIDVNALLDISSAFIAPMIHWPRRTSLGITAGRAKFHSSFFGRVMRAADEHGVDVRELIMRLCAVDMVNAPADLVTDLASRLAKERPRTPARIDFAAATAEAPSDFGEAIAARARELRQRARKIGLPGVFNVVVSPYEMAHVSPYVETRFGCAMTNVMLSDTGQLASAFGAIDGNADYILADVGDASDVPPLEESVLLHYDDHAMWARAAVSHLTMLLGGRLAGKRIAFTGVSRLVRRAGRECIEAGAICGIDDDIAPMEGAESAKLESLLSESDAVVSLSPRQPRVNAEHVAQMREGSLLYDGGIGSVAREAVPVAEARGIRVVRVDMRPSLAAEAMERIATRNLVLADMGRAELGGVSVVAGGLIGREGEVIVDNIDAPTRVIGIADGHGGIVAPEPDDANAQAVRTAIAVARLEALGRQG